MIDMVHLRLNSNGMSLVAALVAMVVLVLAIDLTISMYPQIYTQAKVAQGKDIINALANQSLATINQAINQQGDLDSFLRWAMNAATDYDPVIAIDINSAASFPTLFATPKINVVQILSGQFTVTYTLTLTKLDNNLQPQPIVIGTDHLSLVDYLYVDVEVNGSMGPTGMGLDQHWQTSISMNAPLINKVRRVVRIYEKRRDHRNEI